MEDDICKLDAEARSCNTQTIKEVGTHNFIAVRCCKENSNSMSVDYLSIYCFIFYYYLYLTTLLCDFVKCFT